MQQEIAQQLIQLNQEFYQTFAQSFSATRQRLQPGVMKILETLPPPANVLDLGCGNGMLAQEIFSRSHVGWYVGLDFSADLVKIAQGYGLPSAEFFRGDLASSEWDKGLPHQPYEIVLCFATMHHIPSEELRLRFLTKTRALLTPGGRFINSNWQFMNSPKLRARVQPWERVGLNDEDVGSGDYLMDWRRDGDGLRYVHQFSSSELHMLASKAGFRISGLFTSDGESGDLGLYQIWEAK